MAHCEDKTKAIVKVDGEIVHISHFPPIDVEVIEESKCAKYDVTLGFEYRGSSSWIQRTTKENLYGPILDYRLVSPRPNSSRGHNVDVLCFGKFGCEEEPVWINIRNQRDALARNLELVSIDQTRSGRDSKYILSIKNESGLEEFRKNYEEEPIVEVDCGCSKSKEIECKSDSSLGFCCFSCKELLLKIQAISNKLRYE
jgi:hypothetical protein